MALALLDKSLRPSFTIESILSSQIGPCKFNFESLLCHSMHSSPEAFAQRVAELIDRLARLTRELQFVHGLNPAQWEALRFLARANRYSRSPGALAEFLGTTKGTASQTLIALENKGYIARARSDTDRRAMRLELTPEGEALLQQDPILTIEHAASRLTEE